MSSKIYEFEVGMTCGGCENAVKRVLSKLEGKGVTSVQVDLERKRVLIESTLTSEELLETLKKTGKTVSYIGEKN